MPPLRDRKNDIPLLANAFLKEFAAENGKKVNEISHEAMETLLNYSWPGNVRELRTAIEHAVVLSRSEAVELRDLPQNIRIGDDKQLGEGAALSGDLTIKEAEKQMMINALKTCNGNRSAAAKKLGMSRRTLHRKLHTYQLENL